VLKHGAHMVRAAGVDGQAVGQFGASTGFSGDFGHVIELLKATESIPKAEGLLSFCPNQAQELSSMDKFDPDTQLISHPPNRFDGRFIAFCLDAFEFLA